MKKILFSVFVLSILVPTFAFASFDTSLKYGSRGDAVLELQDLLQAQGFLKNKGDGRFGLVTLNAVKAFQKANGLNPDGYFGKASRTKAASILADQLQSSNAAEQAETGTTTTTTSPTATSLTTSVAGCTSTSAFSATTGQPCASTTQPTTPNLPAGCTSMSGFSITTGQACNGIATAIQQIQQNTQQIAQNTTSPATNPSPTPTPIDVCPNIPGIQTISPAGMLQNGNCITPASTPETDYPGAPTPAPTPTPASYTMLVLNDLNNINDTTYVIDNTPNTLYIYHDQTANGSVTQNGAITLKVLKNGVPMDLTNYVLETTSTFPNSTKDTFVMSAAQLVTGEKYIDGGIQKTRQPYTLMSGLPRGTDGFRAPLGNYVITFSIPALNLTQTFPVVVELATYQPTPAFQAKLMPQNSSPAQQISISTDGAQNRTKASFNVTDYPSSQGGAITELKFTVNDGNTNSVSAVSVNGNMAAVVNGVAYVTGLNITPLNGAGSNFESYVSYSPVGINGVPSGTQSNIALSFVKLTTGSRMVTLCASGCTQTMSPINAPTMTLVGTSQ